MFLSSREWNLAKKSRKANSKLALAFDLGGTKLAAAIINSKGRILRQLRESVETKDGCKSLMDQFERMGRELCGDKKNLPCAIASAGPLDPVKGELLNPTNLTAQGQKWGVVPLTKQVGRRLKLKVTLESDAAA